MRPIRTSCKQRFGGDGDGDDKEPEKCAVFKAMQEARKFVSGKFTVSEIAAGDRLYKLVSGDLYKDNKIKEKDELPSSVMKNGKEKALRGAMDKMGSEMAEQLIMLGELTDTAIRRDIVKASQLTVGSNNNMGTSNWLPLIADTSETLNKYAVKRNTLIDILIKHSGQTKKAFQTRVLAELVDIYGSEILGPIRRAQRIKRREEKEKDQKSSIETSSITMLDVKEDPAATVPVVISLRKLWSAFDKKSGGDGDDETAQPMKESTTRTIVRVVKGLAYSFLTSQMVWTMILTSILTASVTTYGLTDVTPESQMEIRDRLRDSVGGWPLFESVVEKVEKLTFGVQPAAILNPPVFITVPKFVAITGEEFAASSTFRSLAKNIVGSEWLLAAYNGLFSTPLGNWVPDIVQVTPATVVIPAFVPGAVLQLSEILTDFRVNLILAASKIPSSTSEYFSTYGAYGFEQLLGGFQWLGSWVVKCFMSALNIAGWSGIAILAIVALAVWMYVEWKRVSDKASIITKTGVNIYRWIANKIGNHPPYTYVGGSAHHHYHYPFAYRQGHRQILYHTPHYSPRYISRIRPSPLVRLSPIHWFQN